MWADRGVKKLFPEWNQFVDAIFFEKQRLLIAHLDYLHVFQSIQMTCSICGSSVQVTGVQRQL